LKPYIKGALVLGILVVVLVVYTLAVNEYVEQAGLKYIVGPNDVLKADAILVLGAYVEPDGTVSFILNDRLSEAQELYEKGKADRLIVSGDHGRANYDEVNAMKQFLKDKNVPPENIFMDHAGFTTYESIYRARDIFKVKKVIIVTQEYHLMRAIFIARELGLEAYGVASDKHDYGAVMYRFKLREIAARNKAFLMAKVLKPKPTFLGETIPVTGDGGVTDDKR
jgi:SanA protein